MEMALNHKTYGLFLKPANRTIAVKLEQEGAKVFRFEPVRIRPLNTKENAEILRKDLLKFGWIIFPDVFAVDCFLQILEEADIDGFDLDALHIAALGEAVADRLRFVQIHADIIPGSIETQVVVSILLNYLGESATHDISFLIPKGTIVETDLKRELLDLGSSVTEIEVYQVKNNETAKTTSLKALLKGGAIDEFIFDSPEDVISLRYYLANENLRGVFADVIPLGTNEGAIQALRENDLRPRFFAYK